MTPDDKLWKAVDKMMWRVFTQLSAKVRTLKFRAGQFMTPH